MLTSVALLYFDNNKDLINKSKTENFKSHSSSTPPKGPGENGDRMESQTSQNSNHKYKISNQSYILSILNYSKDYFVQIYQKNNKSHLFPDTLSEIKNVELDYIKNYLDKFW